MWVYPYDVSRGTPVQSFFQLNEVTDKMAYVERVEFDQTAPKRA